VLVDGIDIKALNLGSLTESIAVVPQVSPSR
jgi:ABC-type multidrug transport system fused ATPase/permease subunit